MSNVEIISRLIIDNVLAESTMLSLVRIADLTDSNSLTVEFANGSQLIRVSTNKKGIMFTVQDMLLEGAGMGGLDPYLQELGKNISNTLDSDILSKADKFTNSVGRSGENMVEADFLEAIYKLEHGGAVGPFVAVLHPIQVHDLRVALASTTGAVWAGPSGPGADLGAFASLWGVDVFKSVSCPPVNSGADRLGVMMPVGNQSGLAAILKTVGDVTVTRDTIQRATNIEVGLNYNSACVDTSASGGVAIITDHE